MAGGTMTKKDTLLQYYNTVYSDFVSGGGATPKQFSKYLEELGSDFFLGLVPEDAPSEVQEE